jgi:uncharacterized protein (DUF983 family)
MAGRHVHQRATPNRRAVRTGAMSGCPVCGGGHESCQFGPGSPYCVKTACGNPHHRPDPIADLAAAGVMINASYLDAEPASDQP